MKRNGADLSLKGYAPFYAICSKSSNSHISEESYIRMNNFLKHQFHHSSPGNDVKTEIFMHD